MKTGSDENFITNRQIIFINFHKNMRTKFLTQVKYINKVVIFHIKDQTKSGESNI
jgi:hypothetical protein